MSQYSVYDKPKDKEPKNDKNKKINFSGLWPGYMVLQCFMILFQYMFDLNMPWYAVWFPTVLSIIVILVLIVIIFIGIFVEALVD